VLVVSCATPETIATGVIPVVAKQNENETIGSGQITSFCRKKFNTQSS